MFKYSFTNVESGLSSLFAQEFNSHYSSAPESRPISNQPVNNPRLPAALETLLQKVEQTPFAFLSEIPTLAKQKMGVTGKDI